MAPAPVKLKENEQRNERVTEIEIHSKFPWADYRGKPRYSFPSFFSVSELTMKMSLPSNILTLSGDSNSNSNSICSSGDELATKVRKPYTISKQRERWSEEEHLKFLEALKMYGRAWRRIEEHIATKTAVQIRSHAQKFFSKLVRGSSGKGVSSTERAQDIEIPPPRPKRKPRHPYPRKAAGTAHQGGSPASKEGDVLPSVVSSVPLLSLGDGPCKRARFDQHNAKARLSNSNNGQDVKLESPRKTSTPLSLKLFGQTMLVSTIEGPNTSSTEPAVSNNQEDFQEIVLVQQESSPLKTKAKNQILDDGDEILHRCSLNSPTTAAVNSVVYSGSVSTADRDWREKTDSDEQISSELDTNSSCLTRNQESPSIFSGYPRHVPVQCVVDGAVSGNVNEVVNVTPLGHSALATSMSDNTSSLSKAEIMSPWPSTFSPVFPWVQMQHGDTAVAEAVAVATVAAASAWWSLYGAVPSLFHPRMFSGATVPENISSAFKTETVMGAREQNQSNMTEREGETLLQGSPSENYTSSLIEESNDAQGHEEKQSIQTEEEDQIMIETELGKERSQCASNTPSGDDSEIDPYSGTNIHAITRNCVQGFQCNGGGYVPEAEEGSSIDEEEMRYSNNLSTKQGGLNKAKTCIQNSRNNICSRVGGHFNDTWKDVSNEGRIAFRDLFAQEFLPQSFSPGDGMFSKINGSDSLFRDSKQKSSRNIEGEICPRVQGSGTGEEQTYTGKGHTQSPKSPFVSISREKVLEDSEGAVSHELLEASAVNFCKRNKLIASSFAKSKSGVGFVPYERCSMQASKNGLHLQFQETKNCEDVLRDENIS